MSHVLLRHFVGNYPRTHRLRKRHDRQLRRAVRPSKRAELWYRSELGGLVERVRAAGTVIYQRLRLGWQFADVRRQVADETPAEIEYLIAQVAERFGSLDDARRIARGAAVGTLGEVDDRIAATIKRSIGVDLRRTMTPAGQINEALDRAVRENVELITSIPAQYFERIREEVIEAWSGGIRWESLAEKFSFVGGLTEARARFIARDQTSKMTGSFNKERQVGMGIERYTWSTVRDSRVRPDHAQLNGTVQRWDSPPVVEGEAIHPQQAVNCRCAALPIIDIDEIFAGGEAVAA